MAGVLYEREIESAALAWLESLGWTVKHGPDIAPDGLFAEPACASHADRRQDYGEVVLAQRLRDALARLNPDLPAEALLPRLISGELRVKDAEKFLEKRT